MNVSEYGKCKPPTCSLEDAVGRGMNKYKDPPKGQCD